MSRTRSARGGRAGPCRGGWRRGCGQRLVSPSGPESGPAAQPDKSIRSSTAGSRLIASGACLASARNDSISVSTELIHPVAARASSHARERLRFRLGVDELHDSGRIEVDHQRSPARSLASSCAQARGHRQQDRQRHRSTSPPAGQPRSPPLTRYGDHLSRRDWRSSRRACSSAISAVRTAIGDSPAPWQAGRAAGARAVAVSCGASGALDSSGRDADGAVQAGGELPEGEGRPACRARVADRGQVAPADQAAARVGEGACPGGRTRTGRQGSRGRAACCSAGRARSGCTGRTPSPRAAGPSGSPSRRPGSARRPGRSGSRTRSRTSGAAAHAGGSTRRTRRRRPRRRGSRRASGPRSRSVAPSADSTACASL